MRRIYDTTVAVENDCFLSDPTLHKVDKYVTCLFINAYIHLLFYTFTNKLLCLILLSIRKATEGAAIECSKRHPELSV